MANKHKISPDQGSMFQQSEFAPKLELPQVEFPEIPITPQQDLSQTDPNPGVAVSIESHRKDLISSLDSLAQVSKRSGLAMAAESGHRRRLEQRYDDVDALVGRAVENKQSMYRESKSSFERALGSSAMVKAGLITPEEAKTANQKEFDEFKKLYADSRGRKARDKYRNKLKKAL